MVNEAPQPVVVSANARLIDGVQAAARYVTFLIMATTAILGFLRARDVAGLAAYIQSYGGNIVAAVTGLVALAVAAYGVAKSGKRGGQLASVAADPRVPDNVVALKE